MNDRVDIVVTVDGTPVPLCVEAENMVRTIINEQGNIHKQRVGAVVLDYHGRELTFSLTRIVYKVKMRDAHTS